MTVRVALLCVALLLPTFSFAHCDTLSGPVVTDAKKALAQHDLTPVLKWLNVNDEPEVRKLFEQTISVRDLNSAARELADRFFFETIVRLHRAAEGAPYSGLRSEDPEPVIRLTDDSLTSGSPDSLLQGLNLHLRSELLKRFDAAREAKRKADTSVEAGREYVDRYVKLTHFVEGVHAAILAESVDHEHK